MGKWGVNGDFGQLLTNWGGLGWVWDLSDVFWGCFGGVLGGLGANIDKITQNIV